MTGKVTLVRERLLARNVVSREFFDREAERVAHACSRMSSRFMRGGRLLAFGSGSAATDAQHIAVEFMHPVLVGKRALPAVDLSSSYQRAIPALTRADDIVVAFAPPDHDASIPAALQHAIARGALCISLPGSEGDYTVAAPSDDRFINQEVIEILYHTLWETVHVFFERQPIASSAGAASFLYPFLGDTAPADDAIIPEVTASIRAKAALDEQLREELAAGGAVVIEAAGSAIGDCVARGGAVLTVGNGGSASDANDFAMDLVHASIPAISLASEPATLTAIMNDIGRENVFARQIIAHGRAGDVAVVFSTSGASANIIVALEEAKKRGMLTVALLGYDGGEVLRSGLADHAIVVRCDQIPRVQEIHAAIYHVLVELLEDRRGT